MVKIPLLAVIFITSSTYAQAFLFQREMIRKMILCKHGDNRSLGHQTITEEDSLYSQQRSNTVKVPMKQHTKSMAYISFLLAIKPSVATASDILSYHGYSS